MRKRALCASILLSCSVCAFGIVDPISIGVTVGGGLGLAGIYASYDFLKCKMYECCNHQWIKPNLTGLQTTLTTKLHGQHLVHDVVLKALGNHLRRPKPTKALVLSFHGWTGGGKNFVSNMIAEHLFVEGMRSKYVHLFVATLHFPHEDEIKTYKNNLMNWIRGNISNCERSLFIFDEMDKMPSGVIDAIKPFIDYHEHVDGQNFRRAVFIFLSNTGGIAITKVALDFWQRGVERSSMTMKNIETLVTKGAFNEKGGLHQSDIIEKNLIDFYVPFLPLEQHHVKLCIKDVLRSMGQKTDKSVIDSVIKELAFYPPDSSVYSKTGCKSVSAKVALILDPEY